jgi:stress-induced morphogen
MSLLKCILNKNNKFLTQFQYSSFSTTINSRINTTSTRSTSDDNQREISAGEAKLVNILKKKFPKADSIQVEDISGGCGSMYTVFVQSVEFKGLRLVKRHQMINEALKAEIKEMHGLRISASTPDE